MGDKTIRAGQTKISVRSLEIMLDLPEGHRIASVYTEDNFSMGRHDLVITIVGPQMPEVQEGRLAKEVELTYKSDTVETRPRLIGVETKT